MLRFSDVMTKFWKRMKILAKKWKKRESENRKFTIIFFFETADADETRTDRRRGEKRMNSGARGTSA